MEQSEKAKNPKKNQGEIRRFTNTIQMVLNSPLSSRPPGLTLIAVQKKGKLRELGECRGENRFEIRV